jgi:hypothetical protein
MQVAMTIFKVIYWAGVIIEMAIRAPLRKTWKTGGVIPKF